MQCAADAGFPLLTLFHCEAFFADRGEAALIRRFADAGAGCEPTSSAVFEKMSYRHTPDGLLGIAATPSLELHELRGPQAEESLWLVAAGIEKPGNLGAMLRSADATGANGLLLAGPVTDAFNPNVVRASVGALFTVPLATASMAAVGEWLDEHGIRVFAASPDAALDYAAADLRGHAAIVVGSESTGLDEEWRVRFNAVRIPMLGRGDSINAAMAATVLLFEARRQRA